MTSLMPSRSAIVPFLLALLLASCSNRDDRKEELYFSQQIDGRLKIISGLPVHDTVKKDAVAIHRRVDDLILLSRDIENLGACMHLTNEYFIGIAHRYGINPADFRQLNAGDHVDNISLTIKQNELDLLNQLILRSDSAGKYLYTAQ
jgi:hypothetical protein